jgi:hypothetical protein
MVGMIHDAFCQAKGRFPCPKFRHFFLQATSRECGQIFDHQVPAEFFPMTPSAEKEPFGKLMEIRKP